MFSWTKAEDDAVMARLDLVHQTLAAQGKLGPALRLLPTTAATSVRKGEEPLVLDGPFVETKEQLLGFYVVDFESLDEALETAKALSRANPGIGGYEVRPIRLFLPGQSLAHAEAGGEAR
ncbi:MAG: YciI family protein [Caulobacteraceae bacterium]|nr:YciI family protein [Caulobacteraceae bacterium]